MAESGQIDREKLTCLQRLGLSGALGLSSALGHRDMGRSEMVPINVEIKEFYLLCGAMQRTLSSRIVLWPHLNNVLLIGSQSGCRSREDLQNLSRVGRKTPRSVGNEVGLVS